jgi:sialic acid synthase SpsE
MESLDAPCYKLAALDFDAYDLRHMVEQTGKPIIRSCPHEIAPKFDGLQLFAPPGYPQTGFRVRNILNGYDGFSYHGTDWAVPSIAAALGSKLVECHLQLDSEASELEANVSLTASQMTRLVAKARQQEAA